MQDPSPYPSPRSTGGRGPEKILTPDFGRTAQDYARYRRAFPAKLFDRLRLFGVGLPGQRLLDLGAGTGLLGSEFVDRGCRVCALDISTALLGATSEQKITCVTARAEAIPFGDETFDAVVAGGCWHWFDRHRAPREILRVLRPGGVVAAIYQMYAPLAGSVAEATERLILRYQPRWRHANSAGISGQVLRDYQTHEFTEIESFSFDVSHPFSHEQWRGFIRTTSAVGASMLPDMLAAFESEHAMALRSWPEPLDIPHRIFAAVARKPVFRL